MTLPPDPVTELIDPEPEPIPVSEPDTLGDNDPDGEPQAGNPSADAVTEP